MEQRTFSLRHNGAVVSQVQDSEGKEIRDGVTGRGGGYRFNPCATLSCFPGIFVVKASLDACVNQDDQLHIAFATVVVSLSRSLEPVNFKSSSSALLDMLPRQAPLGLWTSGLMVTVSRRPTLTLFWMLVSTCVITCTLMR